MIIFWAYAAAVGCAVFNGTAAILQKIGADKQKKATSSNFRILWTLKDSLSYIIGVGLDLMAFGLTLYAVHYLPLFLVQPIIAASVLVTALIEHFVFKRRITKNFILAVIIILLGLGLLAYSSNSETAKSINDPIKLLFTLTPVGLFLIGSIFTRHKSKFSTLILAAISGLAFGGISVAGRSIQINHLTDLISNPLSYAIIGYGLVGILFFTIALQRSSATIINASMIAFETLSPIVVGLIFLGDRPRHNLWATLLLGILLAFSGTILISIMHDQKTNLKTK
ncbi:MAG: hypothetical protein WCI37_00205 [bacterium]